MSHPRYVRMALAAYWFFELGNCIVWGSRMLPVRFSERVLQETLFVVLRRGAMIDGVRGELRNDFFQGAG